MAHNVVFTIPERKLGKADIVFKVRSDSTMIGTLKVSNGTIVWVPANATYGYKLPWKSFDKLMQDQGKPENP